VPLFDYALLQSEEIERVVVKIEPKISLLEVM